jgi:hypothetical protein
MKRESIDTELQKEALCRLYLNNNSIRVVEIDGKGQKDIVRVKCGQENIEENGRIR